MLYVIRKRLELLFKITDRVHHGRPEKYFSIRYKRHGKLVEEGVGWESSGIKQEYCSQLRGQIVANIRTSSGYQSLAEKRSLEEVKKRADKSKAITLEQAFADFLSTRSLKENTIREYRRSLNTAFDDWKRRRVVEITRDLVAQRHRKLKLDAESNYRKEAKGKSRAPGKEEIEKRGGAQANLHMRFLRSLLNFCAGYYEDGHGEPLIKTNPVQRLSQTRQWYRVNRRQTIIKGHDLPKWFEAVQGLQNETVRDYLIFLLLTGCRKQEGLTLKIESVDLKTRTCTFLDPKNRKPLSIPLPKYLFGLLQKRIESLGSGAKYVFPGNGKDGHFTEPKRQIAKVIQESGVNFTLHDLRRLFITTADSLDLSSFAIKLLVNHSKGDSVTGGYVVSDVERLREPAQRIEDKILSLAGVRKRGEVVPIKRENCK